MPDTVLTFRPRRTDPRNKCVVCAQYAGEECDSDAHDSFEQSGLSLDAWYDREAERALRREQHEVLRLQREDLLGRVQERAVTWAGHLPAGPLKAKDAARWLGMSLTTFKDSGAAREVPSRLVGNGTKRKHLVYAMEDLEQWAHARRVSGKSDFRPDAKSISSGSGTTDDASRKALASQILTRLRAKRRASTLT